VGADALAAEGRPFVPAAGDGGGRRGLLVARGEARVGLVGRVRGQHRRNPCGMKEAVSGSVRSRTRPQGRGSRPIPSSRIYATWRGTFAKMGAERGTGSNPRARAERTASNARQGMNTTEDGALCLPGHDACGFAPAARAATDPWSVAARVNQWLSAERRAAR